MWQYNYMSDHLCHFGIKGMRWGIRRYQNKDGTLTPLGKQRLNEKIESVKTSDRFSEKSLTSLLKDRQADLDRLKKLGYKEWAKENDYEDFSEDDQKYEYSKDLGYSTRNVKAAKIWLDTSRELSKKLSEIESTDKGYEAAMKLVDEYADTYYNEANRKDWDLDEYEYADKYYKELRKK